MGARKAAAPRARSVAAQPAVHRDAGKAGDTQLCGRGVGAGDAPCMHEIFNYKKWISTTNGNGGRLMKGASWALVSGCVVGLGRKPSRLPSHIASMQFNVHELWP